MYGVRAQMRLIIDPCSSYLLTRRNSCSQRLWCFTLTRCHCPTIINLQQAQKIFSLLVNAKPNLADVGESRDSKPQFSRTRLARMQSPIVMYAKNWLKF